MAKTRSQKMESNEGKGASKKGSNQGLKESKEGLGARKEVEQEKDSVKAATNEQIMQVLQSFQPQMQVVTSMKDSMTLIADKITENNAKIDAVKTSVTENHAKIDAVKTSVTEDISSMRKEMQDTQANVKAELEEVMKSVREETGAIEARMLKIIEERFSGLEKSPIPESRVTEKAAKAQADSVGAKVARLEARLEDLLTTQGQPSVSECSMPRHHTGEDTGPTIGVLQQFNNLLCTLKDQSLSLGATGQFPANVLRNPTQPLLANRDQEAVVPFPEKTETPNISMVDAKSNTSKPVCDVQPRDVEISTSRRSPTHTNDSFHTASILETSASRSPTVSSTNDSSHSTTTFRGQHRYVPDQMNKRQQGKRYILLDDKFHYAVAARRFLEQKYGRKLKFARNHETTEGTKRYMICSNTPRCKFSAYYNTRTKELFENNGGHPPCEGRNSNFSPVHVEERVSGDHNGPAIRFEAPAAAKKHFEEKHNGLLLNTSYGTQRVTFMCSLKSEGCNYSPYFSLKTGKIFEDIDGHNVSVHDSYAEKEADIELRQRVMKDADNAALVGGVPTMAVFGTMLERFPELRENDDALAYAYAGFKRRKYQNESTTTGELIQTRQDLINWSNQQHENFIATLEAIRKWRTQYEQEKGREEITVDQILRLSNPQKYSKTRTPASGALCGILMTSHGFCQLLGTDPNTSLVLGVTSVNCLLNLNRALNGHGQPFAVLSADCAHQFMGEYQYMLIACCDGDHHSHFVCHGYVSQESKMSYHIMMQETIQCALQVHEAFGVPLQPIPELLRPKGFIGVLCDGDHSISRGIWNGATSKGLPVVPLFEDVVNGEADENESYLTNLVWLSQNDEDILGVHFGNPGVYEGEMIRLDCQVHLRRNLKENYNGYRTGNKENGDFPKGGFLSIVDVAMQACSPSLVILILSIVRKTREMWGRDAADTFHREYGIGSSRCMWPSSFRPAAIPRDTNGVESMMGHARRAFASIFKNNKRWDGNIRAGIRFLEAQISRKSWQSSSTHYTNTAPWKGLHEAVNEEAAEALWTKAQDLAARCKMNKGFYSLSAHAGVYILPKHGLFELLGRRQENVDSFCNDDLIFDIVCGVERKREGTKTRELFTLEEIIEQLFLRDEETSAAHEVGSPFYFQITSNEEPRPIWSLLTSYAADLRDDDLRLALDQIQMHEADGEVRQNSRRFFQQACAIVIIASKFLFRVVENGRMKRLRELNNPMDLRSTNYQCSCVYFSKKAVCEHVLGAEIWKHNGGPTTESSSNPSLREFGRKVARVSQTENARIWAPNSSVYPFCDNVVLTFQTKWRGALSQGEIKKFWSSIRNEASIFVTNLVSLLNPRSGSQNKTCWPTQRVEWDRFSSYFNTDPILQGLVPKAHHNNCRNSGVEIGSTTWAFEFVPIEKTATTSSSSSSSSSRSSSSSSSRTRRNSKKTPTKTGCVYLDGVEFIEYSSDDKSWVISGANGPQWREGAALKREYALKHSLISSDSNLVKEGVFGVSAEFGFVLRLPRDQKKEQKKGKNRIKVYGQQGAASHLSHTIDRETFLPFCTLAWLAVAKRREADALIFPVSHNQQTSSYSRPARRREMEDMSPGAPPGGGLLCLYWPLDLDAQVAAKGKSYWLNGTVVDIGLKFVISSSQCAHTVYVSDRTTRTCDLAYINFKAKAEAGVEHFFVPANVNHNHWVLFWIFGVQTGHPYIAFLDSIGANHRSAKALYGESADVMRNLLLHLPNAQVGIVQSPQQHESPFQHCGLYMLYNLECILNARTNQSFKDALRSLSDQDSDITRTMKRTLKELSQCIFGEEFDQSAWSSDKFPPINTDALQQRRARLVRAIETLYVDYAQQNL